MLIANWWQVLKRALSTRWIVLAGLLSGIEVFLNIIDGYVDIPRGVFAALSGLATCAAFIFRIMVHERCIGWLLSIKSRPVN
ncbi:hypothetical protein [Agrobacterium rosae]|uniref:DUF7940 domain-containing protein n=1 Tax=Agrobacterium rosae TaxID=1972867 RepID=UPI002033CFFA|nr:hypothetical protein [Agrobacterium rosae]MCM2436321.1 hypothetical protein [Agrobacterium rosae]